MIDAGTRVKRLKDILFSRLDEEMLAIDGEAGYCYSLNGPAFRAWEFASAPTSVEEVCERLCKEYRVDKKTCERDVIELFQRLCDEGIMGIDHEA